MIRGAGDLRERIAYREKKDKAATASGFVPTDPKYWANSIPARVETLSGSEGMQGGAVGGGTNYLVTVRYSFNRNPTELDEIVWQGKTLNIHSVIPDERKRLIEMNCSQVTVE